jgi:DNA-binding NarL/FixJ family response regulator
VLEDHRVVGDGVASALVAVGGFASCGVVSSVADALTLVALSEPGARPDVVVADIDLGAEYAFGLPAALGHGGPAVVYLSGLDGPAVMAAAVESGAAGFVHKREPTEALAVAVRKAAAGESAFHLADLRIARSAPKPPTARERSVIRGIVAGFPNKQIAHDLGIEERTVETHIRRLLDRYGCGNRTELAVLALREAWVNAGR